MTGKVSRLRKVIWTIQLWLAILYAVFINLTLVINAIRGLESADKLNLGTHLTRAMFSANFSYWAYQIFALNFADEAVLYNFVQTNPGNLLLM